MNSFLGRLGNYQLVKWSKVLVFALLIFFLSSFLFTKINLPAAHDLPRQMQNGQDILAGNFDVLTKNVYSYTEPDQPFANHHWLYGVFAYLLFLAVGFNGIVIFKILFILFTFSFLFSIALKRSDFWLVALFSIPTILILINRTAFRPEIFSYFFVVLFLYLLLYAQDNQKSNRIYWLIPLQVVWVNTHLFFGVGVMLVLGFLLEKIILNFKNFRNNFKTNPFLKKLVFASVGVVIAIFFNAYGLSGAIYSLTVNTNVDFPIGSAEINSIFNTLKSEPGWANVSATFFFPCVFILLVSFILVFIKRWRKKEFLFANNFIFYFLATTGSTILGAYVSRGLPLFGLIFLLAVTINMNELLVYIKEKLKNNSYQIQKFIQIPVILFLVISLISLTFLGQKKIMKYTEQGIGLARNSESSVQFFHDNDLYGPIFNDTDIGSYLIGELYPNEKVFTDNRFGDAYSAHFFADIYLPMLRDEKKWKEGLDKYKFNTIFFYHYDGVEGARDFLFKRIYDPEWAWVYVDNYAIILVRNIPENKEVIYKFHITNENIEEKLKPLSESKIEGEQLAAADIFNLVGRIDLSMPLYLKLVSLSPERGKVWMVLGRTELTKYNQVESNPYIAALFLERALKEGWKTWETYSYLALAYQRTGQFERQKWAVKQELKIDPENLDGKKWLGIIAEEEIKRSQEQSQ